MSADLTQNVCRQCGNVLGPTSRYCWRCGAASGVFVAHPPPAEIGVIRCPACGTESPPRKKFCRRCGAVLPTVPTPFSPPDETAAGPPANKETTATSPKPDRRTVAIAVAATVVFVLLAGGGFIYLHEPVGNPANTTVSLAIVQPGTPTAGTAMPSPASGSTLGETSPVPVAPAPSQAPEIVQELARPAAPPQRASPRTEVTPERMPISTILLPPSTVPEPRTQPLPTPLSPSTQPPSEPSPQSSSQRPRVEILRPESTPVPIPALPPPAAPPVHEGSATGTLLWSGVMERNTPIEIEGSRASTGALHGDFLPGVPVQVEVRPSDIAIVEPPSPSNGFRRLVLRSRVKRNIVVTITWKRL